MNRRIAHILAMALVATALFADRAAVASSDRISKASENLTLVGRISNGLRRTVSPVCFVAVRQPGRPSVIPRGPIEIPIDVPVASVPVTPAQFPLPPPAV